MNDPWLKVDEVAKHLGFHPDTVRRLLREGRIVGHLISRRGGWRVRSSEVDRYITGEMPRRSEANRVQHDRDS